MRTNNLPWIIAIVMAVVAILSWVYNLNSNDESAQVETVVVEQVDTSLAGEIDSLRKKVDDLNLAHRGLIEENTALRTLNENLKGKLSGTSNEIAQLIQQLDQANIENDAAKAELESILAKVQNGEINTVVPETVVTTSSTQSSESQQMIGHLESTISELEGEMQTLSAELEMARASAIELESSGARTVEPQTDSSIPAVTEQISTSDPETENTQSNKLQADKIAGVQSTEPQPDSSTPGAAEQVVTSDPETENTQSNKLQADKIADTQISQPQSENSELIEKVQTLTADLGTTIAETANLQSKISDLNAEVLYLTAELEIASAGKEKLHSKNSELIENVRTLSDDLESANAQNASLKTTNDKSLADKSLLEADLSDSKRANDALAAENVSLQNNIQNLTVALNQTNAELSDTKANAEYLGTRLRYASKHLRRIRKQIRTTESDTDALISRQIELTASLSDELQVKQTQMERLISDYSAITLESDVVYESGSARLNERGFAALANISEQLLNFPGRIVSVEGHTDSKQISARLAQFYPTNWELSAARAAAAANFLIDQGVPEESVRVVGYGPLRPVASNDSDEGRAANRRIQIRLVPELAERTQN